MTASPQASWHDGASPLPPMHALLLVRFDQRKGSTVVWQRVHDQSLELDSSLEYKALPSGLHNVEQDLVYFTYRDHAGISAFENAPASAAERNASFFALTLLTPLDGSRLGRVWLYARELQALAVKLRSSLIATSSNESSDLAADVRGELDAFWSRHHGDGTDDKQDSAQHNGIHLSPNQSSVKRRPRALTEPVNLDISYYHPASSIISLLDAFGPLIFPLQRAALLRQSILLLQKPPLRQVCDYVYLLSVLTSLPLSVAEELPDVNSRLDPLFTVGTYDLASLTERTHAGRRDGTDAWIACTSDELLGTRTDVYDVKVEFPGSTLGYPEDKTWPAITTSRGESLKATQRDVRRYKALRRKLHTVLDHDREEDTGDTDANNDDTALLARTAAPDDAEDWIVPDEHAAVEPLPWAAVAYDSFLWWASAGERSSELQEEDQHNREVLAASFEDSAERRMTMSARRPSAAANASSANQAVEMSIITFFQKTTAAMLSTLLRIVAETDTDEFEDAKLVVQKADLVLMGLDGWSKADRDCVKGLVRTYFGIDAEVQGATVECCGVRFL